MNDIYVSKGYKNRKAYLKSLAEEYGVDFRTVNIIANTLGKNEDFDGLISSLEDYINMTDD